MAPDKSLAAEIEAVLRKHIVNIRTGALTGIPEAAAEIAALQSRAFEDGAAPVAIRRFAEAILHGDDEHRDWLTEAAERFVAGQPLPPPRGKGTQIVVLQPEGERNA